MGKSIKKKVLEKKKEDKGLNVSQKATVKSQWTPNWLTATIVVVLTVLFFVLLWVYPFSYYKQPSRASTEETIDGEEIGKVTTYEEFKERFEELVKKADTMSPEEFQKEVKELLMKLSTEDLLRAGDYIDGRSAEMATKITATETTGSEETVAAEKISETVSWGWKTEWYRSPFRDTTDLLKDKLTWETFAEPGVFPGMNDTQTRWNDWSAEETTMLVPEGGYLYFPTGKYTLWLFNQENDEKTFLFEAPAAEERIYLTIVRGLPADGGDLDLNQIVLATDYVRAAGTYHDMHTGAYVSLGWFLQQIEAAYEPTEGLEDPNVGENGAEDVKIVVIDLETQTVRFWTVTGPTVRDWERVNDLS